MNSNGNTFDTIVLGLGAAGSPTVYHLAKRGQRVLGIDQFSPPHSLGSSHGDSRVYRQAVGEGEPYTLYSLRSRELCRELENETGTTLLETIGALIISSPQQTDTVHIPHFFRNTLEAAKKHNIPHEILGTSDIRKRFPQFNVRNGEIGYFEPDAGYLKPEECIKTHLSLAKKHGAEIHINEKIEGFSDEGGVVKVRTNLGQYEAKKLVISAGAWLPKLLEPEHAGLFQIYRQSVFWFDAKKPALFDPKRCPIFIWELSESNRLVYGLPAINGQNGGIKIASGQYEIPTTIDMVSRKVTEQEKQTVYANLIKDNLPDISQRCIAAISCLYTVTPDYHFVIDLLPGSQNIHIVSPCSGHGFKHSFAVGETVAQIITEGKSTLDIGPFAIKRFFAERPVALPQTKVRRAAAASKPAH